MLLQGVSNDVVITLLKKSIPDSTIDTYTTNHARDVSSNPSPHQSQGFGKTSLQNAQSKCFICSKTVYAMEFVGAADKAFHKTCFKCVICSTRLTGRCIVINLLLLHEISL